MFVVCVVTDVPVEFEEYKFNTDNIDYTTHFPWTCFFSINLPWYYDCNVRNTVFVRPDLSYSRGTNFVQVVGSTLGFVLGSGLGSIW